MKLIQTRNIQKAEHNPRTKRMTSNYLYEGANYLNVLNNNLMGVSYDMQEIFINRPTFYGGTYASNIADAVRGLEVTYQDKHSELVIRDDVPETVKMFIDEIRALPKLYTAVKQQLPKCEMTGRVRPMSYDLSKDKEHQPFKYKLDMVA